jgi:UDP-N-acetylmuramate dehydrogenase
VHTGFTISVAIPAFLIRLIFTRLLTVFHIIIIFKYFCITKKAFMKIVENCDLINKHTFHIDVKSRYWIDFESVEDACRILNDKQYKSLPVLCIGGGSNLLFRSDFSGILLHSTLKTIEVVQEDGLSVSVRVGSGVVWDDFVAYVVEKGWSGVENLSGIPGEVGASPVQNIGAYGSEAKDTIEKVEALDRETLQMVCFSNEDCQFGYRNSIFKQGLKDRFIICYVTYKLSKQFNANIKYDNLTVRLQEKGEINLKNIRQAVLDIRGEKLPDPAVMGNAGSFFMNPEIPAELYKSLRKIWPQMKGWPQENGKVKVSAAWCIDQVGWKGKRLGNAAVHDHQALVIVNPGMASAADIIALSDRIILDVKTKFDIELHPEVLFI